MEHKTKIVVTGGTGFVGANLVRELCKNKRNEITIFAREISHPFLKGLKIKRVKGDIRDYKSVLKAVRGADYVYHLAACTLSSPKYRKEVFGINVGGTENVMKACLASDVKKVVNVSSSSVFGFSRDRKMLDEKANLDFRDNLYAQSKKLAEDKVNYFASKGLNATTINPSYVIGAGEVDVRRYTLYQSISSGRIRVVYPGGGGNVAVEDVVYGLMLAMKKGKNGQRYILSANNVTLYDFYNLIARLLNKPKIKFVIPRILYYPMYFFGMLLKLVMKEPALTPESVRWHFNFKYFDNSKARKELGWKLKVKMEDAIKRAISYYKTTGVLKDR